MKESAPCVGGHVRAFWWCAAARPCPAQQPLQVVIPAGNVLLPNSNSVPLGPNAGLEGGAHVARVGDPSSAWLNPAGLSRAQDAEISASSGVFQISTLSTAERARQRRIGGAPAEPGRIHGEGRIRRQDDFRAVDGHRDVMVAGHGRGARRERGTDGAAVLVLGRFLVRSLRGRRVGRLRVRPSGASAPGWRSCRRISRRTRSPARARRIPWRFGPCCSNPASSGTAFHLRPVLGVQYDASPRLRLGFMARTPAPTVYSSGSITSEGVRVGAGTSTGLSFFDPDADFAAKLPFEMRGGAAYIGRRFEVEVDLSARNANLLIRNARERRDRSPHTPAGPAHL